MTQNDPDFKKQQIIYHAVLLLMVAVAIAVICFASKYEILLMAKPCIFAIGDAWQNGLKAKR